LENDTQLEGGNMYWAVKSRHWTRWHRRDDSSTDRDWFAFFGTGGLEIFAAWAIAMGMFFILIVSSMSF
jgi:hypothetical protein